jgi:hypothetical protein
MDQILFWGLSGLIAAALIGALAFALIGWWREFRIFYVSAWALVAGGWIFAIVVPTGSHASQSGMFAWALLIVSFVGGVAAAVTGMLVLGLWAWRERR